MPNEFLNLPNAEKLARNKDLKVLEKSGKITGEMLRETGINMDFAPVMDIGSKSNKNMLGDRAYSDNIDEVSRFSTAVMKGIQEEKVIPVIKHFPGHGATKMDSHYTLSVITKKMKQLEEEDIQPFKRAIENGADTIMIGHLIVSDFDKFYPASLSPKFIVKYLRKKLRFSGVIITDDLKMKAISILYGKINSIILAIKAGNDIVLTKNKYNKIIKAMNRINKNIQKGKISEARINRSVRRILKMKQKYNITDKKVKGTDIDKINKKIKKVILEINE